MVRIPAPPTLHYPITITDILKKVGDDVKQSEPIFDYFYEAFVTEGQSEFDRAGRQVKRKFFSKFESPYEGTVEQWHISKDDVLHKSGSPLAEVDEACEHNFNFGGLCGDCGKDLTVYVTATKATRPAPLTDCNHSASYNQDAPDADRATHAYAHIHKAYKVSPKEAARVDAQNKQRLVNQRRLCLVVDLDLTIIQASVDPTIGEWMRDPTNPNYEAVKDVRSFQLHDEALGRKVDYYIKLRPGLRAFLKNMNEKYELYIYTMGTHQYARQIRKLVDPDESLFGDRILSRTETPHEDSKNLRKFFPIDTKMCVIIDDRSDVWRWSPYLIRVTPYNFFVGIGDINASFLPKLEDTSAQSPIPASAPSKASAGLIPERDNIADGDDSALEQFVSMRTSEDINTFHTKVIAQDEAVAAQLTERPLLQQQKMLEQQAAAQEEEESTVANGHEPSPSQGPRGPLLRDDDDELRGLEQALELVHERWYSDYEEHVEKAQDKSAGSANTGRAGGKAGGRALGHVPDVKHIIGPLKKSTLFNDRIAFSGVMPTNAQPKEHKLGRMVAELGGIVDDKVTRQTDYLVARHGDPTHKMRKAASLGKTIVTTDWLYELHNAWWKSEIPIEPYLVESAGLARDELSSDEEAAPAVANALEDDDGETSFDEEDFELDLDDGENWDESDSEEDGVDKTGTGKKRRRADESDSESVSGGSKLQKRKRQALSRVSSLHQVATLNGAGDGAESAAAEGTELVRGEKQEGAGGEEGADSDLDFDEAFDQELERQASEED